MELKIKDPIHVQKLKGQDNGNWTIYAVRWRKEIPDWFWLRRLVFMGAGAMGEIKHLVVVKFKEGVVVEEIIKGMEKLVSEVDLVKSFEWGQDSEGHEMLTQGFTHSFAMTFDKKEDYAAFQSHPNHVEYSATFSAAIEKIVVLCFPCVRVKPTG